MIDDQSLTIHPELAYTNLYIEAVVVIRVYAALVEMILQHILMRLLTTFDLVDQSFPSLGEFAHSAAHEALPPEMLCAICASWPLTSTDADENTHFSPWPLIDDSLI